MLLDICYHVIKNIQNSVNLLLSLLYESRKITCWCFMKEKKVAVIKLNDFFLFLHNDNLLFYDLIFVMSNRIKCFTSLTQTWTSPCLFLLDGTADTIVPADAGWLYMGIWEQWLWWRRGMESVWVDYETWWYFYRRKLWRIYGHGACTYTTHLYLTQTFLIDLNSCLGPCKTVQEHWHL